MDMNQIDRNKRGKLNIVLDENNNNLQTEWAINDMNYSSSMSQKTAIQFQDNYQFISNHDEPKMTTNLNLDQQQYITNKLNKFNLTNQLHRLPLAQLNQNQYPQNSIQAQNMQSSSKMRFNSCQRYGKKQIVLQGLDKILPSFTAKSSSRNPKSNLNKSGQLSPHNGSQITNQNYFFKQNQHPFTNKEVFPQVINNINQRELLEKIEVEEILTTTRSKKSENQATKKKDVRAIQFMSAYGNEEMGQIIVTNENLKSYLAKLNDPDGYDGRLMIKYFQEHFKMWEVRVSKIHKKIVTNIFDKELSRETNFIKMKSDCQKQQQDLEEVIENAYNMQQKYQQNTNLAKVIGQLQKRREQFKSLSDYLSIIFDYQDKLNELLFQKNVSQSDQDKMIDLHLNQNIRQRKDRILLHQQYIQDAQFDLFIDRLRPYLESLKCEYQGYKNLIHDFELFQQKLLIQIQQQQKQQNQNELVSNSNEVQQEITHLKENIFNINNIKLKYEKITLGNNYISKKVMVKLENDKAQIDIIQKDHQFKILGYGQNIVCELIDIVQSEFHLNLTQQTWINTYKLFQKKLETLFSLLINKDKDPIEKRIEQIRSSAQTLFISFQQFTTLFMQINNQSTQSQNQLQTRFLSNGEIIIGNIQCQEELLKAMQHMNSFANSHTMIMQQLEQIKRKIDNRIETQYQSTENIGLRDGYNSFNVQQGSLNPLQNIKRNIDTDAAIQINTSRLTNTNNNESQISTNQDGDINLVSKRRYSYYQPIQRKSTQSNQNKKKLIIRGIDKVVQVQTQNSDQSTQLLSRQSNQFISNQNEYEEQELINTSGYNSLIDISQTNTTSVFLKEESLETENPPKVQHHRKGSLFENKQNFIISTQSTRQRNSSFSFSQKNENTIYNLGQNKNQKDVTEFISNTQDRLFIENTTQLNKSQDLRLITQVQSFQDQKMKKKQIELIPSSMRLIRVQKKFLQTLITESSQIFTKGDKREEYNNVQSFHLIPPNETLGLSSIIINILKQDIQILYQMNKQLRDLREMNPLSIYIKKIDQNFYHQQNQQQNQTCIDNIIELVKQCIYKAEKAEDIDIQQLINRFESQYGILFTHLFCLAIEQRINLTKLISMEEIIQKSLNRMIDGLNFPNMEYLEIIISDYLNKIEKSMSIISQYLSSTHSIMIIYEKYTNLLSRLQIQNSVFYGNNKVLPNFDEMNTIIQQIQDILYNSFTQNINSDQQQMQIVLIIQNILAIFKNSSVVLQSLTKNQIDQKSILILHDRIDKIIQCCVNSSQYLQYNNKQNNLNTSNFNNSNQRKQIIQSDQKTLYALLKRLGEYLISKNENVIIFQDINNQTVFICKHNQRDYSNPIDKLYQFQNNFNSLCQQEQIEAQQGSIIGKNYSEIYKQIVLSSKYFDSIASNNKLMKQQLKSLIYNGNQYEKEGCQIIKGNKGDLYIDVAENLYYFDYLKQNQCQAKVILIDPISETKIHEFNLQSNITKFDQFQPAIITLCKIQILCETDNVNTFSSQEFVNEKSCIQNQDKHQNLVNNSNRQQADQISIGSIHVLFEKDICFTHFIHSYIRITNENINTFSKFPIKYSKPQNLIIQSSISPYLSNQEMSQTPDVYGNQSYPYNIKNYDPSPSPINKRISQDSIYQSTLKVIEEENYSSISLNNIDTTKEITVQSQRNREQNRENKISPEKQSNPQKSFLFPQIIEDQKEEQYTQFRYLLESNQFQSKEDSLKDKCQILSKRFDQSQKRSIDVEEKNIFGNKNNFFHDDLSVKENNHFNNQNENLSKLQDKDDNINSNSQYFDQDQKQEVQTITHIKTQEQNIEDQSIKNIQQQEQITQKQEQIDQNIEQTLLKIKKSSKSKECSLPKQEQTLSQKVLQLQQKEQTLQQKEQSLSIKEQSLLLKEQALLLKEQSLSFKQFLNENEKILPTNENIIEITQTKKNIDSRKRTLSEEKKQIKESNKELSIDQQYQMNNSNAEKSLLIDTDLMQNNTSKQSQVQNNSNKSLKFKQIKQEQQNILRQNNYSSLLIEENQNQQNKLDNYSFQQIISQQMLNRQKDSTSNQNDTVNQPSITLSVKTNKKNNSNKPERSTKKLNQSSNNIDQQSQDENISNILSFEQSQEYITIDQYTNLQHVKNSDTIDNNKSQNSKKSSIKQKEKRSSSFVCKKQDSNKRISKQNSNSLHSSISQKSKHVSINQYTKQLQFDNGDELDFDCNPQFKSFNGLLNELKTAKINIDL